MRFLQGSRLQVWALAFCLFVSQAHAGSMTLLGVGKVGGGFTPSCSQSSAFLARATTITLTADKTNYDTLICGIVTDGVFSKLDALYIFAAPDSTSANLNLISSSFTADGTGHAPTFSAYNGYTGNGSTQYLTTGADPSTGSLNYQRDAASFGSCVLTNPAGDFSVAIGSSQTVTTIADQITRTGGGSSIMRVNNTAGSSPVNSTRIGMYINSRTTSALMTSYKTGSSTGTDTNASQPITSLPAFFVLARNDAGSPSSFSAEQLSMAFIGGALTGTDASNFYSRVHTFMAAYSLGSSC